MTDDYTQNDDHLTNSIKDSNAGFQKVDIDDDTITIHKSSLMIYIRVFIVIMGSYTLGYSWIIYNQLYHTIAPVYNIPKDQRELFDGLINSVFILGAIFGCGLFSVLKSYRRLLYCALTDIGFVVGGLCLLVYLNIYLLLVGRFI